MLVWSLQLSALLTSAPLCSRCQPRVWPTSRSIKWPSKCPSWFLASFPWCCAAPGLVCPFPLTAVHTDVFAADATCRHWCSESLAWLYFPHCPGFWLVGVCSSQGCLYKWICYYYKSAVFKRYYPKPKQHQCNLLNLPWSIDVGGVRTANN